MNRRNFLQSLLAFSILPSALIHKLINNPAPTIWYTDTNESAKQFSQTRLYDEFGFTLVQSV
jgi:hypothetical protein